MKKSITFLTLFALVAMPVLATAQDGSVTTETSVTAEVSVTSDASTDVANTGTNMKAQKEAELKLQKERREAALLEKKAMLESKKQERSATMEEKKGERQDAMETKKVERTEAMDARKTEREEKRADMQNDRLMQAKERADKEIERRIAGLTSLAERVSAMKRLSEADKASLEASLSAERAKLVALQSQIASDTSTSTLRTSIESIGKSYRVFALVMPKASITAAADRVLAVAAQMEQVRAKLTSRVAELKSAGTDTASLDLMLAEMSAHITEARRLAQSAVDQVAGLTPDEGDKAKMEANMQAFRTAHSTVKNAQSALKSAHENARKVVAGIKGSGRVGGEVETTSSTQ